MANNTTLYQHCTPIIPPSNYSERRTLVIPTNILYGVYIVNGMVALIGVFGNIFVVYIISIRRKMYTIANLFLMNLAIADLCILTISYPLWIIQSVVPDAWPFGEALCKVIPPISDVFYGVSLGCIMAISIHRYRMIVHPMGTQMLFIHAKVIIIFLYGISLLSISAPLYPVMRFRKSVTIQNATNETGISYHISKRCYWSWSSWSYERCYMAFLILFWYVLPLLVILFTYIRIKCYLQEQMRYDWFSNSSEKLAMSTHVLAIKNALRLLGPVVIIFTILMLPWNILRAVSLFKRLNEFYLYPAHLLIAASLLVTNSAVNPFIYYITASDFRREFKKYVWMVLKLFECLKATDNSVAIANYTDQAPNFDEMFREYKSEYEARHTCLMDLVITPLRSVKKETVSLSDETNLKFDDVFDLNRNSYYLPYVGEEMFYQKFWEESTETIL